MKHFALPFLVILFIAFGCSKEEASEFERTTAAFADSLGTDISALQWWKTTVNLEIDIVTDKPVKLWLLSTEDNAVLYDYKEVQESDTVFMTAPQGQGNNLYLTYQYNNLYSTIEIALTGKPDEVVSIDTRQQNNHVKRRAPRAFKESLAGMSIDGNPSYYEFEINQLFEFFNMMNISRISTNAKELGLNCNYELVSNGEFSITWVNGYEADQSSRILGYYYHSPVRTKTSNMWTCQRPINGTILTVWPKYNTSSVRKLKKTDILSRLTHGMMPTLTSTTNTVLPIPLIWIV